VKDCRSNVDLILRKVKLKLEICILLSNFTSHRNVLSIHVETAVQHKVIIIGRLLKNPSKVRAFSGGDKKVGLSARISSAWAMT
jgi:hypothetical protein